MELFLAGLIGLFAGWLVNYLSDGLPTEPGLGRPRCRHCQKPLGLAAYLSLATCRQCGKRPSWRTFVTLATGIGLSLWLWLDPPAQMGYWLGLAVLVYFGVTVIIDLEHRYILMVMILAGAILGLGTGWWLHGLANTLIGALVGLGVMGAFYLFGRLFARYRAKKLGADDGEEALGLGDVYLAIVLGLFLGWPRIFVGLLFGVVAGGLVSFLLIVALVLAKRYQSLTVFTAYGPYLVFGAFLLLYLPEILTVLSGK